MTYPEQLEDIVPIELWEDFKKHRKQLKAPMTERAEQMALKRLARLQEQGHDPVKVIEEAMIQGWKGLWPVKGASEPERPQWN